MDYSKTPESSYMMNITISGLLIVMPAVVARLFDALSSHLVLLAVAQLVCTIVLLLTVPVSLFRAIRAIAGKEWRAVLLNSLSARIPILTWYLVAIINKPGIDVAMSV